MESQQVAPQAPTIRPALSRKSIFSVLGLLILFLGLPLGVYLSISQTNLFSKAAVIAPPASPQASFSLETPKVSVATGEDFSVTILVRSDIDRANLFVAKVNFPADKLVVETVATGSAQFSSSNQNTVQKWVETKVDNQTGQVSLVGGVANPGFKTDPNNSQKAILTTIIFKAKASGPAALRIDSASAIFRNSDQQNILQTKQGLTVNIVGNPIPDIDSASSSVSLNSDSNITVLYPNGGENLSYFNPTDIKWTAPGADLVNIGLILNGEFLGQIASNIANNGQYTWNPQDTLPIGFINPYNTFQIEVSADEDGQVISGQSNGPFGINMSKELDSEATSSAQFLTSSIEEASDLNQDGKLNLTDLSLLFSNYNKQLGGDTKRFDLNQDGGVNDIDLWYLMNFLIKNNVIHL